MSRTVGYAPGKEPPRIFVPAFDGMGGGTAVCTLASLAISGVHLLPLFKPDEQRGVRQEGGAAPPHQPGRREPGAGEGFRREALTCPGPLRRSAHQAPPLKTRRVLFESALSKRTR